MITATPPPAPMAMYFQVSNFTPLPVGDCVVFVEDVGRDVLTVGVTVTVAFIGNCVTLIVDVMAIEVL